MNLAQSGYRMLMILSVVDGQYSVEEGKIIVDYLTKNYELDIDLDAENQELLQVPKAEIPDHFKKSVADFLEHSTEAQRIDFIAFAYRLIQADGKADEDENKILNSLAHFWHIDIAPLIDDNRVKEDLDLQ